MKRLDFILPLVLILVLTCGLPLPTFHGTYSKFTTQMILCAGGLVVASLWFLVLAFRPGTPGERTFRDLGRDISLLFGAWSFRLLLALVALAALSRLWCGSPEAWGWAVLFLATNVGWAILVYCWICQRGDHRAVLRGYLVAGVVASVVGIVLFVHDRLLNPALWGEPTERLRMPLGNANFMAGFLITPVLLAFAAASDFASGRRPVASGTTNSPPAADHPSPYWVLALLMAGISVFLTVTLLLTGSRAGGLGLAVGGLLLLLMRTGIRRRYIMLAGLAATVLVGALAVIAAPSIRGWLTKEALQGTNITRAFLWGDARHMIAQRPLLGWGAGGFSAFHASIKSPYECLYYYLRPMAISPHNEFLEMGVEYGLPGMALYIAFLLALMGGVLVGRTFERASFPFKAVIAGFIGLNVQSCFDVGLRFWDLAPFFWLAVGMIWAAANEDRRDLAARSLTSESASRVKTNSLGVAVLACLAVFGGAAWCVRSVIDLVGEIELDAGRCAQDERPFKEASAYYRAALGKLLYFPDRVIVREYLSKSLQKEGRIREAIAALEELQECAPNVRRSNYNLGLLYIQAADQQARSPEEHAELVKSAIAALHAYLKTNDDAEAYCDLARAHMRESPPDTQGAASALRRAFRLRPELLEAQRFRISRLRHVLHENRIALIEAQTLVCSDKALAIDYLEMADILKSLKKNSAAREALQAGLKRFPANPLLQEALKRMK
jgi:O-antigen ligase/tetratricopeptide (TPR) repeat protein